MGRQTERQVGGGFGGGPRSKHYSFFKITTTRPEDATDRRQVGGGFGGGCQTERRGAPGGGQRPTSGGSSRKCFYPVQARSCADPRGQARVGSSCTDTGLERWRGGGPTRRPVRKCVKDQECESRSKDTTQDRW